MAKQLLISTNSLVGNLYENLEKFWNSVVELSNFFFKIVLESGPVRLETRRKKVWNDQIIWKLEILTLKKSAFSKKLKKNYRANVVRNTRVKFEWKLTSLRLGKINLTKSSPKKVTFEKNWISVQGLCTEQYTGTIWMKSHNILIWKNQFNQSVTYKLFFHGSFPVSSRHKTAAKKTSAQ